MSKRTCQTLFHLFSSLTLQFWNSIFVLKINVSNYIFETRKFHRDLHCCKFGFNLFNYLVNLSQVLKCFYLLFLHLFCTEIRFSNFFNVSFILIVFSSAMSNNLRLAERTKLNSSCNIFNRFSIKSGIVLQKEKFLSPLHTQKKLIFE
jgi:hypothetical protein